MTPMCQNSEHSGRALLFKKATSMSECICPVMSLIHVHVMQKNGLVPWLTR